MFTEDPLQMRMENIHFDFDRASMGWVAEVQCNYPEAVNTGELLFRNHTVYSGDYKKVGMLNG